MTLTYKLKNLRPCGAEVSRMLLELYINNVAKLNYTNFFHMLRYPE